MTHYISDIELITTDRSNESVDPIIQTLSNTIDKIAIDKYLQMNFIKVSK